MKDKGRSWDVKRASASSSSLEVGQWHVVVSHGKTQIMGALTLTPCGLSSVFLLLGTNLLGQESCAPDQVIL